jgi:hypothetical protein
VKGMSDKPEELPEAVSGLGGESDVVAARSGSTTARARRPVPADPADERDEHEADEEPDEDEEGDVTRPDAGPTG